MLNQARTASAYRDLSLLKALADKLDIAVLLIHHLHKQFDSDPLNRISGTTGIAGAVDSTFVLERDIVRPTVLVKTCSIN